MKLKTLNWIYLILLAFLILGCSDDTFEGSDNIITVTRELPAFTNIVAGNDMQINVVQKSTQIVEVIVNENLQSQLKTIVDNNTLILSLEAGSYDNATLTVNIEMPSLEFFELNDNTRGSVGFSARQLGLKVSGSSRLHLEGASEVLNTTLNNAGIINGFSFSTDTLNTNSGDASELEITCNSALDGTVNQASIVRYRGTPTVSAQISESGRVVAVN